MTDESKIQQLLEIFRHINPTWVNDIENLPDFLSFRFMLGPGPDTAVIENPLATMWLTVALQRNPDGTCSYVLSKSHEAPPSSPSDWTLVRGRYPSITTIRVSYAPDPAWIE